MKMNQIIKSGAALVLSLFTLAVINTPSASAATKTWDGGGVDNNLATAANWEGDSAPSAGDDLVFPVTVSKQTLVNDFSAGTSFNSITVSGSASEYESFVLSGAAMEIVGGITVSATGEGAGLDVENGLTLTSSQTFTSTAGNSLSIEGSLALGTSNLSVASATGFVSIQGVITGSGNVSKSGAGYLSLSGNNSSYSGSVSSTGGTLSVGHSGALGTTGAGTTISDGSTILVGSCDVNELTLAENITLTGDGVDGDTAKLLAGTGCLGGGGGSVYYGSNVNSTQTVILTGTITLSNDVTFNGTAKTTTITGPLVGNFKFSLIIGSGGRLVINSSSNGSSMANGTYTPELLKVTLSDDLSSTGIVINEFAEVTLNGKRSSTLVNGILKGTGNAGSLTINSGGTVKPGSSPGCLSSADLTFSEGGIYEFEIGGTTACTGYDQIIVTGTVVLGNGTLSTVLPAGVILSNGQAFTIINNDGGDAVTGTFNGLAEGATFEVNGSVFKISYVGGDGNDVVLTLLKVGAPNTGLGLSLNNPLAIFAVTASAAAGILVIARRYKFAPRR